MIGGPKLGSRLPIQDAMSESVLHIYLWWTTPLYTALSSDSHSEGEGCTQGSHLQSFKIGELSNFTGHMAEGVGVEVPEEP